MDPARTRPDAPISCQALPASQIVSGSDRRFTLVFASLASLTVVTSRPVHFHAIFATRASSQRLCT
ncbi:hypothetical protein P3T27_007520 [Kitasatospora sp. MAA19]|nr:hypothetical protein [Kitasatospora sp. MAA19]